MVKLISRSCGLPVSSSVQRRYLISSDVDIEDIEFPLNRKIFNIEKIYLLKGDNYQARIEKRGNKLNSVYRFSEKEIIESECIIKQRRMRPREYEALSIFFYFI